MERDREATENRLLEAIGSMVAEQGFEKIGINAVAARAGVSKILIYRYFGSVEGLMAAYVRRHDFWLTTKVIIPDAGSVGMVVKGLFRSQIEQLRTNVALRRLYRWELSCTNESIAALRAQREEAGLSLIRQVSVLSGLPVDKVAFTATLVTSSITYLVMLADYCPVYNGFSISTDGGWQSIANSVDDLVDRMLAG